MKKQSFNIDISKLNRMNIIPKENISPIWWNEETVCFWLKESLGHSNFSSMIMNNKVDGSKLKKMINNREMVLEKIGLNDKEFEIVKYKFKKLESKYEIEFKMDGKRSDDKLRCQSSRIHTQKDKTDPKTWSVSKVAKWVKKIGFGSYKTSLVENGIDGVALLLLTNEDLEDMGIKKVGHQKKIMNNIRSMRKSF